MHLYEFIKVLMEVTPDNFLKRQPKTAEKLVARWKELYNADLGVNEIKDVLLMFIPKGLEDKYFPWIAKSFINKEELLIGRNKEKVKEIIGTYHNNRQDENFENDIMRYKSVTELEEFIEELSKKKKIDYILKYQKNQAKKINMEDHPGVEVIVPGKLYELDQEAAELFGADSWCISSPKITSKQRQNFFRKYSEDSPFFMITAPEINRTYSKIGVFPGHFQYPEDENGIYDEEDFEDLDPDEAEELLDNFPEMYEFQDTQNRTLTPLEVHKIFDKYPEVSENVNEYMTPDNVFLHTNVIEGRRKEQERKLKRKELKQKIKDNPELVFEIDPEGNDPELWNIVKNKIPITRFPKKLQTINAWLFSVRNREIDPLEVPERDGRDSKIPKQDIWDAYIDSLRYKNNLTIADFHKIPKEYRNKGYWDVFHTKEIAEKLSDIPAEFLTAPRTVFNIIKHNPSDIEHLDKLTSLDDESKKTVWKKFLMGYPQYMEKAPAGTLQNSDYRAICAKHPEYIQKVPEEVLAQIAGGLYSDNRETLKYIPIKYYDERMWIWSMYGNPDIILKHPDMKENDISSTLIEIYWYYINHRDPEIIFELPKKFEKDAYNLWIEAAVRSKKAAHNVPDRFNTPSFWKAAIDYRGQSVKDKMPPDALAMIGEE